MKDTLFEEAVDRQWTDRQMTFNNVISHIFPKKFVEIAQVVHKV